MHWRNLMKDNKYLGAWDLEVAGKYEPKVVTIERIYQDTMVGEMGKEDKVFAKLKEFPKAMVCNRTNFKRLETFFSSFNPDEYIGKQIVLTTEKVKSPQGMVDALRFSTRPIPQKTKAKLTKLDAAVDSIKNGRSTFEKIAEAYELTDDQVKALTDASN